MRNMKIGFQTQDSEMHNNEPVLSAQAVGASGTSSRGRSLTSLACAVAAALLLATISLGVFTNSSVASDNDDRGGTNGSGTGDWFAGDDEYGGTLPMVGDDGDVEGLGQFLPQGGLSFYLQAPATELLNAIISAGPGVVGEGSFATYEFIPTGRLGQNDLRLTFHGAIDLSFDATLLQVSGVQCGLALGESVESFGAALIYGDRVLSTSVLSSGESFPLPFAELYEMNLLGKVQLVTSDGKRARTVITLDEIGGLISVGQSIIGGSRR